MTLEQPYIILAKCDPNNEPRPLKTKELRGCLSDKSVRYKNKWDDGANTVNISLVVFHIYSRVPF